MTSKPSILVVGGWFDAENLYGALETYRWINEKNPQAENRIVMGPWYHGGWVRSDGRRLGDISFGSKTGDFYVEQIELPFFEHHLKGAKEHDLPEAMMFETGSNVWRRYAAWPPPQLKSRSIYLHPDGLKDAPAKDELWDEFISDPNKPVPFTADITTSVPKPYMLEDQRFSASRPDVMVYESQALSEDMIVAGPIDVVLFVSSSATDSDWIVKVIDVYPGDAPDDQGVVMSHYQMMVRGDIIRAKFRDSLAHPTPTHPGEVTKIAFGLQDVNHCFRKGHRLMVQVQCSWFPLFDANPQKFMSFADAVKTDFQKATQRIHLGGAHSSHITLGIVFNGVGN